MKYLRFGNAGVQVSRLSLGCMDFTTRLEEAEAESLLNNAIDAGVNLLDTADCYENGRSEEFLGRTLKTKRNSVLLATKFWINTYKRLNGGGCSRVHILQAVEDSLRRLQTDYIDLYQLHHPDVNTPVEEVLSTLDALVKQGKIRYIGVSNHYAWQMAHMLGVSSLHNWEPLVSVQYRYNIMDRAVESEIVPFVERFNIATMIYGALNWGILAGSFKRGEPPPPDSRVARVRYTDRLLNEDVFDVVEELHEIAGRNGISMAQLALAWLMSKPSVTTVILGGSKPEHFEQQYEAVDAEVDAEDLERIDEISLSWKYAPFHNQAHIKGAPLALNRW